MNELPEQIYLQAYDTEGRPLNATNNEVTWCVDQINENDAVYILATPELAALLERLAACVPYTTAAITSETTEARALAARIREACLQERKQALAREPEEEANDTT